MSMFRADVESIAAFVESDALAVTYQSLGQYRRDLLAVIRDALALPEACRWHQDDEGSDLWLTGCLRSFHLDEGGPSDNRMEYCCYCGRPLYEVLVKMGKDMPPPDAAEIVARLRELSDAMALLGCDMEYVGGIGPMGEHGREMMGAAKIAAEWADEINRDAVAVATHDGGRDD